MRRAWLSLFLGIVLLAIPAKAHAWFFWFFDEPMQYQAVTVIVMSPDKKFDLGRLVGKHVTLTHATKNAPIYDFEVKADNVYRKKQVLFLAPRVMYGSYNISMDPLEKNFSVFPPKFDIGAKSTNLLILYKEEPSKNATAEHEGKGEGHEAKAEHH